MESQLQTRTVFTLPVVRSNRLGLYLLTIHFVMLVSVLSVVHHSIAMIAIVVLMGCSFIYYLRRYYFLTDATSLSKLSRDSDNNWFITYSTNSVSEPLMLASSYVSQYCVILYFKGAGFWSEKVAFIMSDAVDSELFRQLRVYCRDPKTFQK
ncbi:MAG: protein YgfX [Gammaproteobacteria bacterium]|nr:protein YgfX [Gammaproteobacteria bacterium]